MERDPSDDESSEEMKFPEGSINVSLTNTGGTDTNSNQLRFSSLHRVWELCGFEMETDFRIRSSNEPFAYGETIFTHPSETWWINVDGVEGNVGVLEFVFRAQFDWDALSQAIDQVRALVEVIQEALLKGDCPFGELLARGGLEASGIRRACIVTVQHLEHPERGCRGAPQATIGVPLQRLAEILLFARELVLEEFELQIARDRAIEVANREGIHPTPEQLDSAAQRLRTSDPQCVLVQPQSLLFRNNTIRDGVDIALEWGRDVRSRAPKHVREVDIDRAIGLMAMIMRYLTDGYYATRPQKYAKAVFSVMARTHFAAMFQALGTAKELFANEIWELLRRWTEDSDLTKMYVCRHGFYDVKLTGWVKGKNVEEDHRTRYGGWGRSKGELVFRGPSIHDWIASILDPSSCGSKDDSELDRINRDDYANNPSIRKHIAGLSGKDLMSRGTVAFNSISMGLFDIRRIERVPFAVIEFRQWPAWSIEPCYWKRLLGRIWSFFYQNCFAVIETENVDLSSLEPLGHTVKSEWSERVESLFQLLGDLSLRPNGECLFESVLASGLVPERGPNQSHTPQTLRRLVANELRAHWDKYINFIPNDVESGDDIHQLIERAAAYLETPGNWSRAVADLAVVVLANALDITITITQPNGPTQLVGSGGTDILIPVRYNGTDHYAPGD